jgi:hypothetical protein
MRVFTIKEPVFKVEPLFVLGCEHDRFHGYIRRRFGVDMGDGDPATAGRMFTLSRTPWRVVWTKRRDAGVLLHECFHLVTRICQDKGIPIRALDERGDFGDETAAYLFEFFAARALKRMGK